MVRDAECVASGWKRRGSWCCDIRACGNSRISRQPTADKPRSRVPYPDNPNGAMGDVAGICDATGRVFGSDAASGAICRSDAASAVDARAAARSGRRAARVSERGAVFSVVRQVPATQRSRLFMRAVGLWHPVANPPCEAAEQAHVDDECGDGDWCDAPDEHRFIAASQIQRIPNEPAAPPTRAARAYVCNIELKPRTSAAPQAAEQPRREDTKWRSFQERGKQRKRKHRDDHHGHNGH